MKRRLLLSLALCAVLGAFVCPHAARADERSIHTTRPSPRVLPLPKEDGVFHFVIFGDRTGGPPEGVRVLAQAVRDTNLLSPDLVMTVGDLVQGYNQTAEWMEQMREFRGIMDGLTMPWFPVAGNHDIYWRGPGAPPSEHEASYEQHFGPLWYWFEHKDTGFVVLYTDEGDPETGRKGFNDPKLDSFSDAQLEWLRGAIEALRGRSQVFVFLHHPRWIASRYKESNWDRAHRMLVDAGNVKAVFAGHIHRMRYDGTRDGIEYFCLATTGGSIAGDYPGLGLLHHMNLVTVRRGGFSVATIPVGAVIDPRQFTPEHLADVDRARSMRIVIDSEPVELGAGGEAAGFQRVRLQNPSSARVEIDLEPTAADAEWSFVPDHRHLVLGAGDETEVEFVLSRRDAGFAGLEVPGIVARTEYLADGARIALPPRLVVPNVTLRRLGESHFESARAGSLKLAGKGDCLRVPSARLELPDGPFTLEAWVLPATIAKRAGVVTKTEQSEFGLTLHDGIVSFDVHLDGKYATARSPEPLSRLAWHHLAGVFDGEELRLSIDGRLVARGPASGKRTRNALPLYIGADTNRQGNAVDSVEGQIDEVRLSSVARYTADAFEPATRHAPDEQTVLLLHLDEFLGPFSPAHGSAAHAEVVGAPKTSRSSAHLEPRDVRVEADF